MNYASRSLLVGHTGLFHGIGVFIMFGFMPPLGLIVTLRLQVHKHKKTVPSEKWR